MFWLRGYRLSGYKRMCSFYYSLQMKVLIKPTNQQLCFWIKTYTKQCFPIHIQVKYLRFLGKLADYANPKFRPSVMFPPKLNFSNNFGGLSVITQLSWHETFAPYRQNHWLCRECTSARKRINFDNICEIIQILQMDFQGTWRHIMTL
jgi:hypothetical protein